MKPPDQLPDNDDVIIKLRRAIKVNNISLLLYNITGIIQSLFLVQAVYESNSIGILISGGFMLYFAYYAAKMQYTKRKYIEQLGEYEEFRKK